jgi:hypothetical protein
MGSLPPMKGKLSQLQLIALIGFVSLTLFGIGAYLWLSSELDNAQQALTLRSAEKQKLLTRRTVPHPTSIETLTKNNEILTASLETLQARLKTGNPLLQGVVQKNAVVFKQEVFDTAKKLTELAKKKNVQLPANFYFGFSKYVTQNPEDRDTVFLGKQVLAVREFVTALLESEIGRLDAVRRTTDETSSPTSSSIDSSNPDALRGRLTRPPNSSYQVYPFEIECVGKPLALRQFLNRLTELPLIFVVRSVHISSTQPNPARLEDLARLAESPASISVPGRDKPPVPAMGFEDIKIRIRLDLVEWTGPQATPVTPPAKPGPPPKK